MRSTFLPTILAICFCTLLAPVSAEADEIIGAVDITSPQGDFGSVFSLVDIINQVGLSNSYTSGVTDFASFVSTTTHAGLSGSGFTNTSDNGPQQFSFALSGPTYLDGVVIWNSGSAGSITSFEVYADDDQDFGNGTTALLLGPAALDTDPSP
ncbi:MAG: hypothetical protein AAF456_25965, partial [Planctomycetota bacterium]